MFNRNIKIILVIGIVILAIGLWFASTKKSQPEDIFGKPIVRIGVELPLSGEVGFVGQAVQKAIMFQMEKLRREPLKYDYQIIFEDVQLSASRAALATSKLIDVNKVSALISIWSATGNIIAQIADTKGVLALSCSYGEQSTKGKFNFNMAPTFLAVADLMSAALLERGVTDVALVVENLGSNLDWQEALTKSFAENNINLVHSELVLPTERDFRLMIAKIKQKNPQMVINVTNPPIPFLFVKQWQEAGGDKNQITAINSFMESPANQVAMFEGLWLVDVGLVGSDDFIREFETTMGSEAQSCSGVAAANLQILVDAFENAEVTEETKLPTNEAIAAWIWANVKDYDTPAGKTTIINEGLFNVTPSVKVMKDGRGVLVSKLGGK